MRTRTYLTTPPGAEPTAHTGRREPNGERYVPALDLPTEPRVPGKHRNLLVVLGVVVAIAALAFVLFRVGAAAQAEDPALSDPAAASAPTADELVAG